MKQADVIIVGAGPAGIFSAIELIRVCSKDIKIVIVDSGYNIYNRTCPLRDGKVAKCINCKPCHIMHGFGGAGTFSDCKLSLTHNVGGNITDYITPNIADNIINYVEHTIANFDSDSEKRQIIGAYNNESKTKQISTLIENANYFNIEYTNCPTKHLGTDGTFQVMKNMYEYLMSHQNITFCFNETVQQVTDLTIENKNTDYKYNVITDNQIIYTDNIIFAVGRSGNTWFKNTIAKDLDIRTTSNNVDIGVRVEVNADAVDYITNLLYDMKFSQTDSKGNKIRTFCTNPHGFVSEEHYDSEISLVNGHSYANKKSNRTNFALLITLNDEYITSEYIKQLIKLKNSIVGRDPVAQDFKSFINNSNDIKLSPKNTLKTAIPYNLNKILPYTIKELIAGFMYSFNGLIATNFAGKDILNESTTLYGLEAKFYSERIKVNNRFETYKKGIYVVGDGSGITRGIMQSASTGVLAALDIAHKFIAKTY